jgi:hypothetical protein
MIGRIGSGNEFPRGGHFFWLFCCGVAAVEAGENSAREDPMGNRKGRERAQLFIGDRQLSRRRPSCGTDLTPRTDGGNAPNDVLKTGMISDRPRTAAKKEEDQRQKILPTLYRLKRKAKLRSNRTIHSYRWRRCTKASLRHRCQHLPAGMFCKEKRADWKDPRRKKGNGSPRRPELKLPRHRYK